MITNGWKNSYYYQGNYYIDDYYLDWGPAIGEILYLSLYSLITEIDSYFSIMSTLETYYSIISTEVSV
jgi:hypothetical protein